MQGNARLISLDTIRGVAVMGILAMNIIGFASVLPAYFNPHVPVGASPADIAAHIGALIFVDGKMRGLFSLLFGASMLLIADRAEAAGIDAGRRHFARMAWLLAFGLAHLYLLWWGDILHHYAIVGLAAFAFRQASVRALLATALALMAVHMVLMAQTPLAVIAAQSGYPDPASASATLARLQQAFGSPSPQWIASEITVHRSSYADILAHRWQRHALTPLNGLFLGAETLAYMLLGMAALRSGMLSGDWPPRRYRRWAMLFLTVSIPAFAGLAWWIAARNFDLLGVTLGLLVIAVPFRAVMVIGYACLIALACRPNGWLTRRLAAAGRMAFSNYIASSIVCTTLFYGYGLGLYGTLSRIQLYGIVLLLCVAMLVWSQPWLARFRHGPLEWLWRSAAVGKPQRLHNDANGTQ